MLPKKTVHIELGSPATCRSEGLRVKIWSFDQNWIFSFYFQFYWLPREIVTLSRKRLFLPQIQVLIGFRNICFEVFTMSVFGWTRAHSALWACLCAGLRTLFELKLEFMQPCGLELMKLSQITRTRLNSRFRSRYLVVISEGMECSK